MDTIAFAICAVGFAAIAAYEKKNDMTVWSILDTIVATVFLLALGNSL